MQRNSPNDQKQFFYVFFFIPQRCSIIYNKMYLDNMGYKRWKDGKIMEGLGEFTRVGGFSGLIEK